MDSNRKEDLTERTFQFARDVYDNGTELFGLGGLARRLSYQRESREAKFWLRLADAKRLGSVERRTRLLKEADELVAIFTSAVKRLQLDP